METDKKSLYIETTIPSYATSRASHDIVIAARQLLTKQFWEEERSNYELYTSQYTIDECALGDSEAALKRLSFLAGIPVFPKTPEDFELAKIYFDLLQIPERAEADCFHLAVCVNQKINYLLSWNFTHLGFKSSIKMVEYNTKHGLWIPELVTPDHRLLNFTNKEELL
jgi:hypothetical protein